MIGSLLLSHIVALYWIVPPNVTLWAAHLLNEKQIALALALSDVLSLYIYSYNFIPILTSS